MPELDLNLRPAERLIVDRIFVDLAANMGMTNAKVVGIERKSNRDFDVKVDCDSDFCKFGMWLPLGAIRSLTVWTDPKIARMTDHPEMAMEGDWSGVRDSSSEAIWAIFTEHVHKVDL